MVQRIKNSTTVPHLISKNLSIRKHHHTRWGNLYCQAFGSSTFTFDNNHSNICGLLNYFHRSSLWHVFTSFPNTVNSVGRWAFVSSPLCFITMVGGGFKTYGYGYGGQKLRPFLLRNVSLMLLLRPTAECLPTASAMAKIRLLPKVKIVSTVQHWP